MFDTTTLKTTRRELAHRASDAVEVTLLWCESDDSVAVQVIDTEAGSAFEVAVAGDRALDAYYHPYAYAARHGIDYDLSLPSAA
jgi:hypothetical protein